MHRIHRPLIAALAALGTALVSSCQPSESSPTADGTIEVATTIAMIGDLVERIGGEHVSVDNLIGEGVDPHLYKPTSQDVKDLMAADLVLYNGLMLEGKMGDTLVKLAGQGKAVHAVTETILEQGDYVITDEEDHYDPHVWMDVQGWKRAVGVITEALSKYDPSRKEAFESNAAALLAELDSLDTYARERLASIPESQRILVTAHDAFGYMARAYGLEVRGIQGLSTESEAGVRDLEELIAMIVERKVPAVFVETSVSKKNIEALIEGAAAKGHTVTIGGELFSDAMGEAGSYEGTYVGMIDHNVTTIARALGGEAPEKGLNGKLAGH